MSRTDCFCQLTLSRRESKQMTALSRCAASTRHKPFFKREHCKRKNRVLLLLST